MVDLPSLEPKKGERGAAAGAAEARNTQAKMAPEAVDGRPEAHDPAALLAAIVESSEDAILSKDLRGIITSWNGGAQRLFGYTGEEVIGKSVTILIPEDRLGEEPAILARIHAGERVDHFETIRRRKDGTLLDISLTISPVRSNDGRIVGASKVARDITERRRAAERQALLLREMHHRIKNLFAVAGGIITLAARTADSPASLARAMKERLVALARAHEMTLPSLSVDHMLAEPSTTLFKLLDGLLAPYSNEDGTRAAVTGQDVGIGGRNLVNLALLLHELVTNAAKYGALSVPDGRIAIDARIAGGDILHLTWAEQGGPPVTAPTGIAGFGTRLEESIKQALRMTILREWRRDGMVVRMSIPVSVLSAGIDDL
ncbi:PAS domain S-box protein [Chelatococcus reniformis]|uniref:Blue-light-activated histidine kinase n=1 Tax=Chelatococcus reniformis TaxID=1494448 RepID=A0A916UXI8_9HYPH|nr:PAS domain S-box protein [Chelatococcus reniformis]GGC93225.1 histidine kinase [Chelatococcus reniformis]